jgi:hypothetical protein
MATVAEQEHKLAEVLSILGEGVEPELARVMLESVDWDVERVVSSMFEEPLATMSPAASPSVPPRIDEASDCESTPASSSQSEFEKLSVKELFSRLDAHGVDRSSCMEKADLVRLLQETVEHPRPRRESTRPSSSRASSTSRVSAETPAEQPLLSAFSEEELRSLLDAHGVAHEAHQDKDELAAKLEQTLGVAAGQNWTPRTAEESSRAASASSARGYANEVLQWAMRTSMGDGGAPFPHHPGIDAGNSFDFPMDHFLNEEMEVSPEEQQQLDAERETQRLLASERRAEIAMQDAEFQESLQADQRKQAEREAQEAAEYASKHAENEAAAETQRVLEEKRVRISCREPDSTNPDCCQVVVRTPSGKRLSRRFLFTDDLTFLYDWLDVVASDDDFTKKRYLLVSRVPGMPSNELARGVQSLREAGLDRQSMLFVSCSD